MRSEGDDELSGSFLHHWFQSGGRCPGTRLFWHEKRIPSSLLTFKVLNMSFSGKATSLIVNILGFPGLLPSAFGGPHPRLEFPLGEGFQSVHITEIKVHSDILAPGMQSWTWSAPFVQVCPGMSGGRGKSLSKAVVMDSLWFMGCGQIAWGAKKEVPRRLEP